MATSSHPLSFDSRLLAIEEFYRRRQFKVADADLCMLDERAFSGCDHDLGLWHSLRAEMAYLAGNYRQAVEHGLKAARLLADLPENRRYGAVQRQLSKTYSAIGDLRNAEMRARDALAAFRRGTDHVGQIDSLNELARVAFIRCDYRVALGLLLEALELVGTHARKRSQLVGNIGRIRLQLGEWDEAETALTESLQYAETNDEFSSQVANLLSLGYLALRRRQFASSARFLDRAHAIITRHELKREQIIYLEYAGELAFERGEYHRAKAILSDAYNKGMLLSPSSALISQTVRRLADVELALENTREAMKYAQKALDLATELGEKLEIGLARRVIGKVFVAENKLSEGLEYSRQGIEVLRQLGDPYELARSLVSLVETLVSSTDPGRDLIRQHADETIRIFKSLAVDYWVAETEYLAGVYACQCGDLGSGFRALHRAERLFVASDEPGRVKAVSKFLLTLADQAVALSVSEQNEFKLFGRLLTPDEFSRLKGGALERLLELVKGRSGADRGIIITPSENGMRHSTASPALAPAGEEQFLRQFERLLGQEIARQKPTLLLDCRRDPHISGLFAEYAAPAASILVVPFQTGKESVGYVYLDKVAAHNGISPFSQTELNFAVGFSDLIAFRWLEIQKQRLAQDNERLKRELGEFASFPSIVTRNQPMIELLAQVRQVVNSPISISLEGETGTGKDLLARAIHFSSTRRDRRFISVNCAALPETLLESELFGYKKGAFTGADRDKAGLFEEADGGTFFLDEIGDMPLGIQAKILRVLENKEIVRLGETTPRTVDVRVVSATNRNLRELMGRGEFRQDLFYRLTALSFRLPALRERRDDIPLLIDHFLAGSGKTMAPDAREFFQSQDWPGNIRQFDNEIKRLLLLSGDSDVITLSHFDPKGVSGGTSLVATGARPCVSMGDITLEFSESYSLYDYLNSHERHFIIMALREARGVKKHAAAKLNIPESTLRLKLKQHKIDPATGEIIQ